ncbi:polysaccharide deacetylase family protein [Mucilaginibacter sp. UR6-1]|uniref:polysaccharide deacetylase family protein n=1 Tax=Mucilaginibacter sp. UR6-1 TaxID=1435643 RepID=UPI001E4BA268|nr:polysaccharide deacetylase family protein [Mucilaginibacter sp. UR6-1]MCC8407633.1 polysaccharide deacetylase family protein [Mucilaginibacter sp. UR6-1]
MLKHFLAVACFVGAALTSCQSVSNSNLPTDSSAKAAVDSDTAIKTVHTKAADATTILSRPQVPVICYHQIRNWRPRDSKSAKDYIVEPDNFKAHIKMLADSGYHTILPDQLYDYLVYGKALPSKPVMLTFDDTDLDQYTIAAPELKKYGYKAVYFIMTVSIGRPNYMNSQQIKELSDEGNIIGSHTWDHHNFKKLKGEDWLIQLDKPTKRLEDITGKKIEYFAYPFGLWNIDGLPELKSRGFKLAFQLAEKRDQQDPLYTVRRILGSGYWSPKTLHNSIKNSF